VEKARDEKAGKRKREREFYQLFPVFLQNLHVVHRHIVRRLSQSFRSCHLQQFAQLKQGEHDDAYLADKKKKMLAERCV
jgi:hypothetical protein